jgi:cytochrome c biogenesis protein CcmG/thiol:disulfide interchange protein DsbE
MPRRLLLLLPIVLLGFIGFLSWRGLAPDRDPSALPSALIGKPAPSFDIANLDPGKPRVSSKAFAGQVAVVNFFASWCLPCRAEHPMLFQLGKDDHVAIYGIAYKDKPDDTARYIGALGSPYREIGLDQSGRVAIDYGVTGVPETFILDRDGIIRYRLQQPIDPDRLAGEIDPLIKSLMQ